MAWSTAGFQESASLRPGGTDEPWDRHRPTKTELAQLAEVWLKINSVTSDDLWPSRGQERSLDEIETGFQTDLQTYADWVEAEFPAGVPNGNGDYAGTRASPLDAKLASPGLYGGPTRSMIPLAGSPHMRTITGGSSYEQARWT